MSRHSEAARAVDTLAVIALTTLVLLGFDGTFADRTYLVGGGVGLVAVVVIALIVDYYDKGTGVMLLCALPTYVVLGASVGVRSSSGYVRVPTADSLVDALSATIGATNQLLTTIPPVDTVGDATLVPYAVGFLVGGTALWAALRTERPAAPVLPLLVGLAVSILLGTQERESLLVQAGGFAGGCLWWVAVRGGRQRMVAAGERGRTTRVAAAAVLVAVVAGTVHLVLPEVRPGDPDRVVLRGRVGSGHDVSGVASPLSSFRRFTRQPASASTTNVHDRRLLRVTGLPEGIPLRFVALDDYDGVTWRAGNRTVADASDDLYLRIGSEVGAGRRGEEVEIQVEVARAYLSDWVPLPGQLTGLTFDYLDGRAQRSEVRYNPATTTAVVIGGLDAGDDYTVSAVVAGSKLGKRMASYPTDGPLQPAGAFLDESLRPWVESGLSPMDQVRSLAKYLRVNGRYSDGASPSERIYPSGHDVDRLGEGFFLARRIVGDDEQYAAFLALAANRLGVPARVVVGAVPRRRGLVEGRDVSSWVEVRVRDGSWRTVPTEAFMSRRLPRRNDPPRELPAEFLDQPRPEPDQQPEEIGRPTRPGEPDTSRDGDESGSPAPEALAWSLPLVGLVVWLVPLSKVVRRRRRAWTGRSSDRIVGGWREVLDLAHDLGRGVPGDLTRPEQARRMGLDPSVALSADDALFARREPAAEQAVAFWAGVHDQRRALREQVGPLRRTLAVWNPSSLLPLRFGRARRARRLG